MFSGEIPHCYYYWSSSSGGVAFENPDRSMLTDGNSFIIHLRLLTSMVRRQWYHRYHACSRSLLTIISNLRYIITYCDRIFCSQYSVNITRIRVYRYQHSNITTDMNKESSDIFAEFLYKMQSASGDNPYSFCCLP